jgi:hypothetical protein
VLYIFSIDGAEILAADTFWHTKISLPRYPVRLMVYTADKPADADLL